MKKESCSYKTVVVQLRSMTLTQSVIVTLLICTAQSFHVHVQDSEKQTACRISARHLATDCPVHKLKIHATPA